MLEAVGQRGSVDRLALADAAGISQEAAASELGRLLDAGEVLEVGESLRLADLAAEAEPERLPHGDISITVRTRAGLSGESREMVVRHEADEDPRVVAETIAAVQKDLKIPKHAKRADEERLAALAAFVDEHGSGVAAMERWNRNWGRKVDRYETRQSFNKAVGRAVDSAWHRLHKLMAESVEEARETGEPATLDLGEAFRSAMPGRLRRDRHESEGGVR